jgi:diadenosine tetraphosphate (Ap4A) HIT family hydrolase
VNDCFICAKLRDVADLPGGELLADEHCVVSHVPLDLPEGRQEAVYLGYLMVEPRRHVAELGDLTPAEAASLGRLAASASGALQKATGAEHIYAAIIGHGIEHLHLHLIPRYPGTPREYWWTRVDEWPGAPRGNVAEVQELARRIRSQLA